MQTFYEYLAQRQALPDPVTMYRRLGIDPSGPNDVEVMRLVKRMKAAERGPKRVGLESATRPRREETSAR